MVGGQSVVIFSIFIFTEVNGCVPICREGFVEDGCNDLRDWEDSIRRTTTASNLVDENLDKSKIKMGYSFSVKPNQN